MAKSLTKKQKELVKVWLTCLPSMQKTLCPFFNPHDHLTPTARDNAVCRSWFPKLNQHEGAGCGTCPCFCYLQEQVVKKAKQMLKYKPKPRG